MTPYALALLALLAFVLSLCALLTGRELLWLELTLVAGLLVDRAQAV